MPAPEGPTRPPRAALRPRQVWGAGVLVAAVALLGIVVVAAEDRPLVGPDASASLDVDEVWRSVAVVGLGLATVGGLVVLVLSAASQRPRKPVWRQRHTWLVWLAALVLGTLGYLVLRPSGAARPDPPAEEVPAPGGGEAGDDPARPAPPWAVLTLGLVVVGALAAAVVAGRRMRGASTPDLAGAAGHVGAAMGASIDDLEAAGDPRAAIVAAYARLLEAFEQCGLGRTPAETPVEHLERGLAALAVRPAPARELTGLFLEARFSEHPLGEPERQRALAALRAARHDLAGAGSPVGAP